MAGTPSEPKGFATDVRVNLAKVDQARKVMDATLVRLAEMDSRVFLLTADVGASYVTFRKRFPERFIDFGIAEQDMVGAAAGLALEGKIPVATSMAAFISMRACEQVRTDVAYQMLNVKLIGNGCGTSYGTQGTTHHATEDIGIMRSIPNMVVLSPAGPTEASKALEAAVEHPGPVYIRVSREAEPEIYSSDYEFRIGEAIVLREGQDVAIIATGGIVARALIAAVELEKRGVSAAVLNMHTLKPLDRSTVTEVARRCGGRVVTAEDHNVIGGLGSAVAEVLAEEGLGRLRRIGIPDVFCIVGNHEQILEAHHAAAEDIVRASLELVRGK